MSDSTSPSTRPLTVLHVIGQMNRAGAETMVMNLMRHVDRARVRFDFVVHTSDAGDYDDEIRQLGGRIFVAPRFAVLNERSYRGWWDRFFQEHPEIDLVHGHIASSARVYLAAAQRASIPTIAHSHSTDGKTGCIDPQYYVFRWLTHGTTNVADHLMGCSPEAITARYGSEAGLRQDAHVIRNGIDLSTFRRDDQAGTAVRAALGIEAGSLVVGTIGRLTAVKNPDFTLDVVSELVKQHHDVHFLWVGRGELEEHITDQIVRRHLEAHIHLLGVRSDISAVLNALDVFVMCSKYEGLGLSLIEAQACGVPAVASVGVPSEALVTRRARRLPIRPHDVHRWTETILEQASLGRFDGTAEVKAAGYDITEIAAMVTALYEHYADGRQRS